MLHAVYGTQSINISSLTIALLRFKCVLLVLFPHLLHFMITFVDFKNILPKKILWIQRKVSQSMICPSFTLSGVGPPDRSLQGSRRVGLVCSTHLRELENLHEDLLGFPRKMVKWAL